MSRVTKAELGGEAAFIHGLHVIGLTWLTIPGRPG